MKPPRKQNRRTTARLIEQVADRASLPGWGRAVERLAGRGARAIGPVLQAMHGPVPAGQHGRDMIENFGMVLGAMARRDPGPLMDVIKRNAAPPDPQMAFVVGALAEAPKDQALPALVGALKHNNPTVRLSAAEALICLRSKRAIGPLVEALRDRSPMVRFTVVQAMHRSRFFRTPAALEPLRNIVRSARVKQQSPGMWYMAVDLIELLQRELARPNSGKR